MIASHTWLGILDFIKWEIKYTYGDMIMLKLIEIKHSDNWVLNNHFFNPELVTPDEIRHIECEDQAYLLSEKFDMLVDIGRYCGEYAIEAFFGNYGGQLFFEFRSIDYNEIHRVVETLLIDIDTGKYQRRDIGLHEFLAKISNEGLQYNIKYNSMLSVVIVEINTITDIWHVLFDEDGLKEIKLYSYQIEKKNPRIIDDLFNRYERAWNAAAEDLGIEFISPFIFQNTMGETCRVTGLLPQFGAPNGVILCPSSDERNCAFSQELEGYAQEKLFSPFYDKYDRDFLFR